MLGLDSIVTFIKLITDKKSSICCFMITQIIGDCLVNTFNIIFSQYG